jgi:hypothetical protein
VPMNHRLLVPRKTPGLLDLVPGAAAAYSLRSLSNSYADPVVTVRRSSDDAEEDFTAAEVSDGTLAAFCGAGDGFVKQWWDQSGNARHASQSTAGSQPKIVDSGAVVTKEGKPALDFDGTNDYLLISPILPGSFWDESFSVFALATLRSATANNYLLSAWGSRDFTLRYLTSRLLTTIYDGSTGHSVENASGGIGDQILYEIVRSKTSGIFAYGNAVEQDSDPFTGNAFVRTDEDAIGARYDADRNELDALYQELLIFDSRSISQRQLIEGNIAWGWSV